VIIRVDEIAAGFFREKHAGKKLSEVTGFPRFDLQTAKKAIGLQNVALRKPG
jgi:hypothetical protein